MKLQHPLPYYVFDKLKIWPLQVYQKITQSIGKVAQTVAKTEEWQILHTKAQSQSFRNIHPISFETFKYLHVLILLFRSKCKTNAQIKNSLEWCYFLATWCFQKNRKGVSKGASLVESGYPGYK